MVGLFVFLGALCAILGVILKTVDALAIPLFIVFLVLKLCGVIAWGWLYVCLPLIVFGGAMVLTIIIVAISSYIKIKLGD